ncbi:MAG: nitroreductase family protein [Candidatus Hodarchaeota archaeon]
MNQAKETNQTLELIKNRRTIRVYKSTQLSQEEIDTIIYGAMRAPTAGNMMMYSIIQVTQQEKKEKLAITCDNQPHIAKAPLILIFLADMQRWWDYFQLNMVPTLCTERGIDFETPQESDLLLACCDALIAAQNAVITAESLGIGSCYIGDIMENIEIHREMFDLPKWVFPITMVCFGYPKGDKEKIPLKERFPKKFIHFIDNYKRLSKENFTEMFLNVNRDFNIKFAKNLGQQFYFGKSGADFSKEMRRSVKVAIKDWIAKNSERGIKK